MNWKHWVALAGTARKGRVGKDQGDLAALGEDKGMRVRGGSTWKFDVLAATTITFC